MKLKLELPVTGLIVLIDTETMTARHRSYDWAEVEPWTDEEGFNDVSEFLEEIK